MLVVNVFYCGVLMLYWTRVCAALQLSDVQLTPAQDPAMAGGSDGTTQTADGLDGKHGFPHHAPCLVDDIFVALCESVGDDGELTNHSFTLFGICKVPGYPSGSELLKLVKENNRKQRNGQQLLHIAGVHVAEDIESGTLQLIFDLPQSSFLKLSPVLLLVFESPLTGENLQVTFTSQSLQPHKQSVCVSGETQYIMLTGGASNADQKWRISADTASPEMKQSLRHILIGGKTGSNINMAPFLLFSGEIESDTRLPQTSSFLCELKRFLGDVMSQDHPESPPLQLASLQSLPPITIGLSSSEALLVRLMNSSALTILSFASGCTMSQVHRGELALSHALLEELRQRLEQTVTQILEVIREELGHGAMQRLRRLVELSAFFKKEPPTGESQYCAFLLLKAFQTVIRTYDVKRGLRAIRADPNTSVRRKQCALRSLTISLERHVIGPNTADINNCHGTCFFPLINTNNHAVLLNSHIENKKAMGESVDERAPCCVPVAYEDMDMVLLDEAGTGTVLKTLTDVVVKECGCR